MRLNPTSKTERTDYRPPPSALRILAVAFLIFNFTFLIVQRAPALNVVFAFTNSATSQLDTNDLTFKGLGTIRNSDGTFQGPGSLPNRVKNPTGILTNHFTANYYTVTNAGLGLGFMFRVYDSSANIVWAGDPSIYCGNANPFVELFIYTNGGSASFTFANITNGLGYAPVSISALNASNAVVLQASTNFTLAASNNVATNSLGLLIATNALAHTDMTNLYTASLLATKAAIALSSTNDAFGTATTGDAAERAAMIATNAATTNALVTAILAKTLANSTNDPYGTASTGDAALRAALLATNALISTNDAFGAATSAASAERLALIATNAATTNALVTAILAKTLANSTNDPFGTATTGDAAERAAMIATNAATTNALVTAILAKTLANSTNDAFGTAVAGDAIERAALIATNSILSSRISSVSAGGIPTLGGLGTNTFLTNSPFAQVTNLMVVDSVSLATFTPVAGTHVTVLGGEGNTAQGIDTAVIGGLNNAITGSSQRSFIAGGQGNTIIGIDGFSTDTSEGISVGLNNKIRGQSTGSFIGGGNGTIISNSVYSFAFGSADWLLNANYSFAGGNNAQALFQNSFVWADGHAFSSTATNQFLVRSAGGIGFNTNAPPTGGVGITGDLVVNGTNVVPAITGGDAAERAALIASNNIITTSATNLNNSLTLQLLNSGLSISNRQAFDEATKGRDTNTIYLTGFGNGTVNATYRWSGNAQAFTNATTPGAGNGLTNQIAYASSVAVYVWPNYMNGPAVATNSAITPGQTVYPTNSIAATNGSITVSPRLDGVQNLTANINSNTLTGKVNVSQVEGISANGSTNFGAFAGNGGGLTNLGFVGASFTGNGGGLTNVSPANGDTIMLYTNKVAWIPGIGLTNFASSTTAGIQEIANLFQYGVNAQTMGGFTIKLATPSTSNNAAIYPVTTCINISNFFTITGNGPWASVIEYKGAAISRGPSTLPPTAQVFFMTTNSTGNCLNNSIFRDLGIISDIDTNAAMIWTANNYCKIDNCVLMSSNLFFGTGDIGSKRDAGSPTKKPRGLIGIYSQGSGNNKFWVNDTWILDMACAIYAPLTDWGMVEGSYFGGISLNSDNLFTNSWATSSPVHAGAAIYISDPTGHWWINDCVIIDSYAFLNIPAASTGISVHEPLLETVSWYALGGLPHTIATILPLGGVGTWSTLNGLNQVTGTQTSTAGGGYMVGMDSNDDYQFKVQDDSLRDILSLPNLSEQTSDQVGGSIGGAISWTYQGRVSCYGSGITNIPPAGITTNGSTAGQILTSVGGKTVWTNVTTTADVGTVLADNVAAGIIGEYTNKLVTSAAAISLTTATAANVTNMTIAAGDWEIEAHVNFALTAATATAFSAGINTTSATLPVDGSECYSAIITTLLSDTDTITLDRKRINVNATTTIYLVAKSTFSAGTETVYGALTARRIR